MASRLASRRLDTGATLAGAATVGDKENAAQLLMSQSKQHISSTAAPGKPSLLQQQQQQLSNLRAGSGSGSSKSFVTKAASGVGAGNGKMPAAIPSAQPGIPRKALGNITNVVRQNNGSAAPTGANKQMALKKDTINLVITKPSSSATGSKAVVLPRSNASKASATTTTTTTTTMTTKTATDTASAVKLPAALSAKPNTQSSTTTTTSVTTTVSVAKEIEIEHVPKRPRVPEENLLADLDFDLDAIMKMPIATFDYSYDPIAKMAKKQHELRDSPFFVFADEPEQPSATGWEDEPIAHGFTVKESSNKDKYKEKPPVFFF